MWRTQYIFHNGQGRTHLNTYSESRNAKSENPVIAQDIAGNIWDGLDKILSSEKDV